MLMKLFNIVVIAWPASEVILGLLSRAKRASATIRDRGSLVFLWSMITLGLCAANFIHFGSAGSIQAPPVLFLALGLAFILIGLAVRWTAIFTLGRFFTPNVAVHSDQRIIRTGIYRWVRHPAYSGLLLAFLGAGLAFGNWIKLLVVLVPITTALLYRIRVEESALAEMLGSEYVDYCKTTKRLIPGIF